MTKTPTVSILLCTHNPREQYFNETIDALLAQSGLQAGESCEIIVIDNASDPPLLQQPNLRTPPHVRVVVEPKLGLTHARRRSFAESRGDFLLYVDDDNILTRDYVARSLEIMRKDNRLGAIGGKVIPRYEVSPPPWFPATGIALACRDLGPDVIEASWRDTGSEARAYPDCAPIGAGMVLRRAAYAAYVKEVETDSARLALGRRGQDLSSGEDNDMVMTVLRDGWTVGYHPQLLVTHLIPAGRLDTKYLRRYAYSSNLTWVQVLGVHGIRPWSAIQPSTALIRKVRAWWRMQPWRGPVQQIAWAGACGLIDGRARLT